MARHVRPPVRSSWRRCLASIAVVTLAALGLAGPAGPAAADLLLTNVVAGGNDTITVGGYTTVRYTLEQANGDGQNKCNVDEKHPGTLVLSAASGVSWTPEMIQIRGCKAADGVGVTFTSTTPGTYPVTVSIAPVQGGSFATAGAAFSLKVLPPADTTPPVLALPGPLTVEATGLAGAAVSWTASAYDVGDDAAVAVTCAPASGSTFALGTTTVACSATDSRGNTAEGFFTVTVRDTSGPELQLTGADAEATSADGAAVTFGATATDLVDGTVPVTCVPVSGSTFALGSHPVDCTATDAAGNTTTGSLTVTVADGTPPELTLTHRTVEATSALGATVAYEATAVDTVSGDVPVTCDAASGSVFSLGVTTVTCGATDGAGNTATGTFDVTVGDTVAPDLTLESAFAEATGPGGAEVTYSAEAYDVVAGPVAPDCSPISGSLFALGKTTVSCSATDGVGNTTTGTLVVTVLDTTAPSLQLPDVVLEATGPDGVLATVDGSTATATDVVDGAVDVTCLADADALYPLGESPVTCTATDAAGNQTSGVRTVRVVDTTAPAVTVTDLVVEAAGPLGAVATYTPGVVEVVTGDVAAVCVPASGSTFAIGTTPVQCTATDAAGNTGGSGFTVTVEDTTAPAFSVTDVIVEATGSDGATATWPVTAVDLVDGEIDAVCDPAPGASFALGSTSVGCTVTDSHNNFATRTFAVYVLDRTPPVLTLPGEVVVEATGPDGGSAAFETSATDVVDGDVTVTCNPVPGLFGLGETTVLCSASDAAGNAASGSFVVRVQDTTGPEMTVTSQTVEATGPDGAAVTFTATATDLVDLDRLVQCDAASGAVFALGETVVECTAADTRGNATTAEFTITVGDTTAPSLTLVDTTAEATGPDGAVVSYSASATDLVDGDVAIGCTPPSGGTFALGATTVTCDAVDGRGNDAEGTLTVRVRDTTPPVLSLSGVTVEATGPAGAAAHFTATAVDVVSLDVTVECSAEPGSTFGVGTTTVTCTATDAAGNIGEGSLEVVVTDTTAPVLTLPTPGPVEATGPTGAVVEFAATATDLVDGDVTVACSPASGEMFPLAITTVSCSATDAAGNLVEGDFAVTVEDTTAPVLVVTPTTAEATGPGGATVSYTATATDVVDGDVQVTCAPPSGGNFPLGTSTVECTATDEAGNTVTVSGPWVEVVDTTAPMLTVPGDLTVVGTSAAGAVVTYATSAQDLVDPAPVVTCDRPSGSVFPPGATTVSCTATDAAGNTSAAQSFVVSVGFAWSGLLAPVGLDGRSAFKAGSTIPVKFALIGASVPATGTPARLSVAKISGGTSTSEIVVVSTSAADSGNLFRVSGGQYIFNLSTKGWSEGQYELRVDLGDGVPHVTTITVKK